MSYPFPKCFDTVIEFLDGHGYQPFVHKYNISYITDILAIFNNVNTTLQGDNVALIQTESTMATLLGEFKIYKYEIGRKNNAYFPSLDTGEEITDSDDERIVYCNHMRALLLT